MAVLNLANYLPQLATVHSCQIYCFGLLLGGSSFSSLSLFVVTKSNPKSADKKNSLRLRLRSNSFLSQRNVVFLNPNGWMGCRPEPDFGDNDYFGTLAQKRL